MTSLPIRTRSMQSLAPSDTSYTVRSNTLTINNSRPPTGRSRTAGAKSVASTVAAREQQIICAISESRGISPTVGLAFINLTTCEAVLCQICDSQTYVKTVHKLGVYNPTEVLFSLTASSPKSKLYSIIEENLNCSLVPIDRKYWHEDRGFEYVRELAFKDDYESLKLILQGNYFATCCFAAVMRYAELSHNVSFAFHTLRIKYEPSEGSMMIDLSTIVSFELIQNLQNAKSKDCLFGLLNETLTPMGSRFLRSNILQPSTDEKLLSARYDAVEELTEKEEMFYSVRLALKGFVDTDRVLSLLITTPTKRSVQHAEQSINNVVMLKQYVTSIKSIYEALTGAKSVLLGLCRELCRPGRTAKILALINQTINEDIAYRTAPIDLRNQRIYAVRSGVNGLLDVARQSYKEANDDAFEHSRELAESHDIHLDLKFEAARQYYFRIPVSEIADRPLSDEFINRFQKKNMIECQTLELVKLNQRMTDSHNEVINMSDESIQMLIQDLRREMSDLFRIGESIATLDMIASFSHRVTISDYVRPELTPTLAIKAGRHPIHEAVHASTKMVPNDVYATQSSRFQIVTGCNMSGKSTYIRTIALITVMAQIGCFVPATYASIPIRRQLFARVTSSDAEVSANVSTFSAEMREMAFILRSMDPSDSMIIIDELGRGTATRDGIHIALAISEALIESNALVWFATHFHDLAHILGARPGVVNLHLSVHMSDPTRASPREPSRMTMLYKVVDGPVQDTRYGLAMAQVIGLPAPIIEHAALVSERIAARIQANKEQSTAKVLAIARRRKLILSLREQLQHAKDSAMQGEDLRLWLRRLQEEFLTRMTAIDAVVRIDLPGSGQVEQSETMSRVEGESVFEVDDTADERIATRKVEEHDTQLGGDKIKTEVEAGESDMGSYVVEDEGQNDDEMVLLEISSRVSEGDMSE